MCVSLMKYNYMVANMPFHDEVSSSLEQEQGTRILDRAYNNQRLLEIKDEVRDDEMNEAREGYENVMNKIIFDANMMSDNNVEKFVELRLPREAFTVAKPAPPSGLWPGVPKHPMQARTRTFLAEAFFASLPAISALQGAVALAADLENTVIINMYYDKTYSLDKYGRYVAEQMLVAQRNIKQQWPTKTGGVIRRALVEAAEALAKEKEATARIAQVGFEKPEERSTTGPEYDVQIRSLIDYMEGMGGKNPAKLLLSKVNFMMGECLFNIVKRNLKEYTSVTEQLCGCDIQILDVRSVRVAFPKDSIYKTKVMLPMFSVSFQVTSEDRCLNEEELAAYNKEMEV